MTKPKPRAIKRKRVRDNTTVHNSPHFKEIKDCLGSGWSPPAIRRYLIEAYGAKGVPSEKAIQRWRHQYMPGASIVPAYIIEEKLQGIDYKVDLMGHLSRLVAMLEDRMKRSIRKEYELQEYPLNATDAAATTYLAALRQWTEAAQDLGIMKAPALPNIDMRTQNLMLNMDPAVMADFTATMRDIVKTRILEGGANEQGRVYSGDANAPGNAEDRRVRKGESPRAHK